MRSHARKCRAYSARRASTWEVKSSEFNTATKIKEIADYCQSDVVNTYRVWLRYELFRGKLTDIAFQASEAELREFITARNSRIPMTCSSI
jgi:3'-5' exonuclease